MGSERGTTGCMSRAWGGGGGGGGFFFFFFFFLVSLRNSEG